MEHTIFKDMRKEDELQKAKALSDEIKNNTVLMQTLENHHIPLERIDTHPYYIERWYASFSRCIGCKGLSQCKQKEPGYFDHLVDDGYLHTDKHACKYMRQRLEERKHLDYFLINDMPDHLCSVSFSKIDLAKEKNEYISAYSQALACFNDHVGVYLYGSMGVGKTYLCACACNAYARDKKKAAFIHYPSFVQRMASRVQAGEYKQELDILKFVPFLVIDEIGGESVTEWNRDSILFPILNERYEKRLPTWFTSNEDLESLRNHFVVTNKGKQEKLKAMRIMERIRSMAKPIELVCENRRNYL